MRWELRTATLMSPENVAKACANATDPAVVMCDTVRLSGISAGSQLRNVSLRGAAKHPHSCFDDRQIRGQLVPKCFPRCDTEMTAWEGAFAWTYDHAQGFPQVFPQSFENMKPGAYTLQLDNGAGSLAWSGVNVTYSLADGTPSVIPVEPAEASVAVSIDVFNSWY